MNRLMLKNKKLIIIVAVALLLVGGVTAYALLGNTGRDSATEENTTSDPENTIDYEAPSQEENSAGDNIKQRSVEQNNPSSPQDEGSSGPNEVGVEVTSLQQDGTTLRVRTLIQTIEQDASCTLTLSRNGEASIEQTVDVQPLASYSTCKGFDIDVSDAAAGSWQMNIVFNGQGSRGAHSQTVTLE